MVFNSWPAAERFGYDVAYEQDLGYISTRINHEMTRLEEEETELYGEYLDHKLWIDTCYINGMLDIFEQVTEELEQLAYDEVQHLEPTPTATIIENYIFEHTYFIEDTNLSEKIKEMLREESSGAKNLLPGII